MERKCGATQKTSPYLTSVPKSRSGICQTAKMCSSKEKMLHSRASSSLRKFKKSCSMRRRMALNQMISTQSIQQSSNWRARMKIQILKRLMMIRNCMVIELNAFTAVLWLSKAVIKRERVMTRRRTKRRKVMKTRKRLMLKLLLPTLLLPTLLSLTLKRKNQRQRLPTSAWSRATCHSGVRRSMKSGSPLRRRKK